MQKNRGIIVTIILAFVAIILFMFAIGYFTNDHPFGLSNYKSAMKLPCGITVSSPKQNEQISFPFTVKGYAGGCGWDPVNYGDVGTVDVIGQNGLVLSRTKIKTKDQVGDIPYYFEAQIDVPAGFIQDSGMFIFRNAQTGINTKEYQVPVLFKTNI